MVKTLIPFELTKQWVHEWGMAHSDVGCSPADRLPHWIGNVQTELAVVNDGARAFPLSVHTADMAKQSWVVSPLTAYVDYGYTEITALYPRIAWLIKPVFSVLRKVLQHCQFDHTVTVNNWLFSTNLYGAWQGFGLSDLTTDLVLQNPSRAICWRSLSPAFNLAALDAMKNMGYLLIPSRQIWWLDPADAAVWQHANSRRDLKLHQDGLMTWRRLGVNEASSHDYATIARLYGMLYLEKYSELNPSYSVVGLKKWHELRLLDFWVIQQGGNTVGCLGFFADEGVLTVPIVGYDTGLPQSLGLYRRLMIHALLQAKHQQKRLHWSAGAASFKRLRGAVPATEYSAVWVGHLPRQQRWAWQFVKIVCERFALPHMQKRML